MPVLAVLLVFGLANTAFAQVSCSVASTPVSRDTDTGHTEVVGDLIFNCQGGTTATTTATMTIDYGVTITNATNYPTATPVSKPISVSNVNGTFATAGQTPSIASVNNATGQIVITIPAQPNPSAGGGVGSFTLTGVLASLNASGKTTLVANVSVSPGNNVLIVAGQNNATVITSILPGILAPIITPNTTVGTVLSSLPVNPVTSTSSPAFSFSTRIRENYIDMFRSQAQYNSGAATQGVSLLLTFAGIPTGVTISGCTVTTTSGTVTPTFSSGSGTNITSTNNTVTLEWTGGPSLTSIDDVIFACTSFAAGSSATIPLTPGSVTMTATLAPTGNALGSSNSVLTGATTGQIPRYANNPLPSPPLTVINITAAQTTFLIPFVVAESGFDTGIAIANTTTDPFGTTNGARPQAGNITFNIFPRVGASCVVTPSTGTVGVGLTSAGILESGRTYSVLLTELLKVAGSNCPTTATGYIIGVASFPLGHGASFVTDFKGFTSASPVLILPPPSLPGNARNALTFEALNN
jgi:hypothetical protein